MAAEKLAFHNNSSMLSVVVDRWQLVDCNPAHYNGTVSVIRSFRHKGLEKLFRQNDARGVPAPFMRRLERLLDLLDSAERPEDMNLPGNRFHALKGEREGSFAVNVSRNWRLTFRFLDADAFHVDLEDYH